MLCELVYTSAPRGLFTPNGGFGTVASTKKMSPALVQQLELLSGFRRIEGWPDAQQPVNYSLLLLTLGGKDYSVFSRVGSAGLDYTQRTNKLAHHLAMTKNDRGGLDPAWLLQNADRVLRTSWGEKEEPRYLEPRDLRTLESTETLENVLCEQWQKQTGDAGWGGALLDALESGDYDYAAVVFPRGLDVRPLMVESLRLALNVEKRWRFTFSTYYTKLPPGIECRCRFLLEGSEEAVLARHAARAFLVDLCRPLGTAPSERYARRARDPESVIIEDDWDPDAMAKDAGGGGPRGHVVPPPLNGQHARGAGTLLPSVFGSPATVGNRWGRRLWLPLIAAGLAAGLIGGTLLLLRHWKPTVPVVTEPGPRISAPRIDPAEETARREFEGKLAEAQALHEQASQWQQDFGKLEKSWAERNSSLSEKWRDLNRKFENVEKLAEAEREELRKRGADLSKEFDQALKDVQTRVERLTGRRAQLQESVWGLGQWQRDNTLKVIHYAQLAEGNAALTKSLNSATQTLASVSFLGVPGTDVKDHQRQLAANLEAINKMLVPVEAAPPAPARPVFEELDRTGGYVALPAQPTASDSADAAPHPQDLCRLYVVAPQSCRLELRGQVFTDGRQFWISPPEVRLDERFWTISLGEKADVDQVASLRLQGQVLRFEWARNVRRSNVVEQLANCQLVVNVDNESRNLSLRPPQIPGEIVWDPDKHWILQERAAPSPFPLEPLKCDLVLEVSGAGIPGPGPERASRVVLPADAPGQQQAADKESLLPGFRVPIGTRLRAAEQLLPLTKGLAVQATLAHVLDDRQGGLLCVSLALASDSAGQLYLPPEPPSSTPPRAAGETASPAGTGHPAGSADLASASILWLDKAENPPSPLNLARLRMWVDSTQRSLANQPRQRALADQWFRVRQKEFEERKRNPVVMPQERTMLEDNFEKDRRDYDRRLEQIKEQAAALEARMSYLTQLIAVLGQLQLLECRIYAEYASEHRIELVRFVARKQAAPEAASSPTKIQPPSPGSTPMPASKPSRERAENG